MPISRHGRVFDRGRRDFDGGPGGLFGDIGLLAEDIFDQDREAARGGVAVRDGISGDQLFAREEGDGALEELCLGRGEHACGNFF